MACRYLWLAEPVSALTKWVITGHSIESHGGPRLQISVLLQYEENKNLCPVCATEDHEGIIKKENEPKQKIKFQTKTRILATMN
jgi:hypothetical protein